MDSDQYRRFFDPDLGPNCLKMLSVAYKSPINMEGVRIIMITLPSLFMLNGISRPYQFVQSISNVCDVVLISLFSFKCK